MVTMKEAADKFYADREAFNKAGVAALVIRGKSAFTGAYGPRGRVPGTPAPTNPNHPGLDIAAATGTPILSLSTGRVSVSRRMADGALDVIVGTLDDGWRYVHNSRNRVNVGDVVSAKWHIADVGSSGNVNGPHLHLERLINGVAVDPLPYLIALAHKSPAIPAPPIAKDDRLVKIVQIAKPDGRTYLVGPGRKRWIEKGTTLAALEKVYGPAIVLDSAEALAVFTETDRL